MNKFNNVFYGAKTHFKMYKKGRQWLVAGVTVISLGLGVLGLNTVTASAATTETPVVAAPATEKTTTETATPVTDSTSNTNTEQSAAETENTAATTAKTTAPVTTNLGDATTERVAAAKTKATAAYEDTGKAQTLTAVAPESTKETTINFNATVKTDGDAGQVLSNQNASNVYNVTVDDHNVIQSVNSSKIGQIPVTIPGGYDLKDVSLTATTADNQSLTLDYDVIKKAATVTPADLVSGDVTQDKLNEAAEALFADLGVNLDGKGSQQFTIAYQSDPRNSVYTNYKFTFIVADTAQTKTVSQPYQTEVKTTDGTVLNSQNATNTYVVRASDDGSILSVTSTDYKDLTDTIPDGYHLTGIQLVDTTNLDQTVTTVTYDPSTGIGNIVSTSIDPATGEKVTTDYSKNPAIIASLTQAHADNPENPATVSEMAQLMVNQLISPKSTANGNQYTASFKNIITKDTLLNGNVNQQSTNTVITYIVAGQPNQGGSNSGNNGGQGSANDATNNNNTNNTDSNTEPTTTPNTDAANNSNSDATSSSNSEAANPSNTETMTVPGTASVGKNESGAQNSSSDNSNATATGSNRVSTLNNASNGGTAVSATTTGANQAAKSNSQITKGTLPQTSEAPSNVWAAVGMGIFSLFSLFGLADKRRKGHDE
ncbi:KxYKxGKxW signal peptide domain-containing protein [Secundilactobacillus yichangensis]|uniref:KxYKxGKxW signal peptide domain-containing protein n=1 Tax=Secundilactobacillus yichangensis TaxID=2799580 RepID=UPI001944F8A1|nr:KxYKxGKxW signal peptide domain-containing protein [Secundilactobacillus yichangensis]